MIRCGFGETSEPITVFEAMRKAKLAFGTGAEFWADGAQVAPATFKVGPGAVVTIIMPKNGG